MVNENGKSPLVYVLGVLGVAVVIGGAAGGVTGYQRAQDANDQQRKWVEERIAALDATVAARRVELRAEHRDERRVFEQRLDQAIDGKIDKEAALKMIDQVHERLEVIETMLYGRSGK